LRVLILTDDIAPVSLSKWHYWRTLKDNHPKLILNCSIVPFWHGQDDQRINRNKRFIEWFISNKDWVSPILHGYRHDHPYGANKGEFEGPIEDQRKMIAEALRIYKTFLGDPDVWGFRPPFERLTQETVQILKEAGCSYMVLLRSILPIKERRRSIGRKTLETYLQQVIRVNSHTNAIEHNKDDIGEIHGWLDKWLSDQEKRGEEIIFVDLNKFMECAK